MCFTHNSTFPLALRSYVLSFLFVYSILHNLMVFSFFFFFLSLFLLWFEQNTSDIHNDDTLEKDILSYDDIVPSLSTFSFKKIFSFFFRCLSMGKSSAKKRPFFRKTKTQKSSFSFFRYDKIRLHREREKHLTKKKKKEKTYLICLCLCSFWLNFLPVTNVQTIDSDAFKRCIRRRSIWCFTISTSNHRITNHHSSVLCFSREEHLWHHHVIHLSISIIQVFLNHQWWHVKDH